MLNDIHELGVIEIICNKLSLKSFLYLSLINKDMNYLLHNDIIYRNQINIKSLISVVIDQIIHKLFIGPHKFNFRDICVSRFATVSDHSKKILINNCSSLVLYWNDLELLNNRINISSNCNELTILKNRYDYKDYYKDNSDNLGYLKYWRRLSIYLNNMHFDHTYKPFLNELFNNINNCQYLELYIDSHTLYRYVRQIQEIGLINAKNEKIHININYNNKCHRCCIQTFDIGPDEYCDNCQTYYQDVLTIQGTIIN